MTLKVKRDQGEIQAELTVPFVYDPESNVIFYLPGDNQGKGWAAIAAGLDNMRANRNDLEALGDGKERIMDYKRMEPSWITKRQRDPKR